MYRAVDTGLQAIDIRSLTEAAQSLGAGWPRILIQVILPNLRVALLSGAFLTLAIVIGEFTIATFLARPAFGPYLSAAGHEPGLRTGRRRDHQLRPHLAGHDPDRLHRPRCADPRGRHRRSIGRARSPMSFLTLTGVQKAFPGGVVAVEDFNLDAVQAASSSRSSGRRAAARPRRCG